MIGDSLVENKCSYVKPASKGGHSLQATQTIQSTEPTDQTCLTENRFEEELSRGS